MPSEKIFFDYSVAKTLRINLNGDWRIFAGLPGVSEVIAQLTSHREITQITFDVPETFKWDSGFISFLRQLARECEQKNINVIRAGLPQKVEKLLAFALMAHEKTIPRPIARESFLEKVADIVLRIIESTRLLLNLLGDIAISFSRLITGKAYFSRDEFIVIVKR